MVRVLFVCLGNICRSPMADGVFQEMVKQAGLSDKIIVDSAGTSSYHEGQMAHGGTRKVLKKNDIPYDGRSRGLAKSDFANFDYILAMDESNLQDIQSRKPADSQATIRLFLDYAEGVDVREVPDPYYTGGFDYVFGLVNAGCEGLLQAIRTEHNL